MARPRILRSVEFRSSDGVCLPGQPPLPPYIWMPVITLYYTEDGELQPISEHNQRITDFLEHREGKFRLIADAARKKAARAKQTPKEKECARQRRQTPAYMENERRRKQTARTYATAEQIERKTGR